jgi:hypothetical protein
MSAIPAPTLRGPPYAPILCSFAPAPVRELEPIKQKFGTTRGAPWPTKCQPRKPIPTRARKLSNAEMGSAHQVAVDLSKLAPTLSAACKA